MSRYSNNSKIHGNARIWEYRVLFCYQTFPHTNWFYFVLCEILHSFHTNTRPDQWIGQNNISKSLHIFLNYVCLPFFFSLLSISNSRRMLDWHIDDERTYRQGMVIRLYHSPISFKHFPNPIAKHYHFSQKKKNSGSPFSF